MSRPRLRQIPELGLTFGKHTLIMGVLNVTPDSFSDGGLYLAPHEAVARAREMVAEGADLIDIGGQSSRPGSEPVSQEEELRRVLPVVEALSAEIDVPISVDTYRARVADACLEAGARLVNDISSLRLDPDLGPVVAEHGAALLLMHMRGVPRDMQRSPRYVDVVDDVRAELEAAMERALAAGVERRLLLVDPGFGFGKTVAHNLTLLRHLDKLRALKRPVVVGLSRKSTLGALTGVDDPALRVPASVAAAAIAAMHGADVVRAHDVAATRQALAVADAVKGVNHQN